MGVCVPGHDVHTLLEVFPVFEAHPQAAYTITNALFPAELGSAQMHEKKQKKEDRHPKKKGRKWRERKM